MAVKTALLKSLKSILHDCIRKQEEVMDQPLIEDEVTLLLCSCIEAIYLHGKTEVTGFSKISRLLQGKNKNQPFQHHHFWDVVHEFVPPHMKEFMSTSISCQTPVGCCRVWIRASLNEGTMQNYLSSLVHDRQKIKKHYLQWAFLRDIELTGTALELLKGLEALRFDFELLQVSLNDWFSSSALHLAGISSSSSQVRIAPTSSQMSPQPRVEVSSYNIFTTSVPGDNVLSFLEDNHPQETFETLSVVSGPRVDEDTTLDDKEVMSFVSPDFDSLLQRSVRESRASSINSFQNPTITESLRVPPPSDNLASLPFEQSFQSPSSAPFEHENLQYLEKSFFKQTENMLSIHGSISSRSPQSFLPHASNNREEHPISSSSTCAVSSIQEDAAPATPLDTINSFKSDLPAGSNSLAAQRSSNSWWSAPVEKAAYEQTQSLEKNSFTKTSEPQKSHVGVEKTMPDSVNHPSDEHNVALHESVSYNDIWSSALPNLIGTYQKMMRPEPVRPPCGYQEESYLENGADESHGMDSNQPENSLPATSQEQASTTLQVTEIHAVRSSPLSQESENASDWQFLGDDFLDKLPAERSRLLNVYPGVEHFSHATGVYGGKCTVCESGLNTKNWSLDYYDGRLYCVSCCMQEKCVIPRDVINSWDFTEKPVSQMTKMFISDMMSHPNINILHRNPNLYRMVPSLRHVCHLRRQLSLLWYQITLCDEVTAYQLRMHLGSRDYMLSSLQEVHLYSLEDLKMTKNGAIEKLVSGAINNIAVPHVTTCSACRQRSVQCELCFRSEKPIYLHELDTYVQCTTHSCSRVLHRSCVKALGVNEAFVMCKVCQNCVKDGLCPATFIGGYDDPSPLGGSVQSIDCSESH